MLAAWGMKAWGEGPVAPRAAIEWRVFASIAQPALALTVLLTFELMPLPSRMISALTPATDQLYRLSFPGWPFVSPYQAFAPAWSGSANADGNLAPASPAPVVRRATETGPPAPTPASRLHWRTLAIAPAPAASGLVEWLALASVFSVVLVYPFGLIGESEADVRFYRIAILTMLAVGVALALLGLAQRAWWNGKLLWFYEPSDWGGARRGGAPRISGPFVDPDHFADYLAMLLPAALVTALFPPWFIRREHRSNVRLAAALASMTIAIALLLSLSRAGWAAALAGSGAALGLALVRVSRPDGQARRWSFAIVITGCVAAVALLLFASGPLGRLDVDSRLGATFGANGDASHRLAVWRDTLGMIHDFAPFGVGLGGWPELFPHYQRAPWLPFFFRQAENDYLQLLAETGLIGGALALWLGATLAGALRRGAATVAAREWPLIAGLAGGLVAVLVHEAFDFSLHTPANAFLCAIVLALAMRLTLGRSTRRTAPVVRRAPRGSRMTYAQAATALGAAVGLSVAAYWQDGRSYPYALAAIHGRAGAEAAVIGHPAMAAAHLLLLDVRGPRASTQLRTALIAAALWLDPNEPAARDQYARDLILSGHSSDGLAQIAESVYRAPRLESHYYLRPELIPWLLPEEQGAIERGFQRAVAARFAGAIDDAVGFYGDLGRYADAARLLVEAASREPAPAMRLDFLIRAGRNYALANDDASAARTLHEAIALAPADARAYDELARAVDGPGHRLDELRATIQDGLRAGADSSELNVALADGAELAGDRDGAEAALSEALRYRPTLAIAMRLGGLYEADQRFARAAAAFEQATEFAPGAAAAWFALGGARAADYDYAAADRAYGQAHRLAPDDTRYTAAYEDFERRTRTSGEPTP
jgi:tetratricopeptide (TPR) repeat protein